jgi:GAF domain-containing protein
MFDLDDRIAVRRNEEELLPDSSSAILSRLITRGTAPNALSNSDAITTPSELALLLDAPIVLVTMVENGNLLTYHSFGLAPGRTLGKLSTICHRKCQEGTYLKADITRDKDFAEINDAMDIDGNSFFIGVPVYGNDGDLIGTIAVLDKSRNIAVKDYSIGKLRSCAADYIRYRVSLDHEQFVAS